MRFSITCSSTARKFIDNLWHPLAPKAKDLSYASLKPFVTLVSVMLAKGTAHEHIVKILSFFFIMTQIYGSVDWWID